MKQLIVFAFFAAVFFSCNSNVTNKSYDNVEPLSVEFTEESFEDNEGKMVEDSIFSTIAFHYPIFSGGNENATKRINEY
ncbi:MAG: hypothetical protein NWQ46_10270, partial [Spirosomaceae bacterium]|nr:hypothetical protein [Spirosomataceae bacterium]